MMFKTNKVGGSSSKSWKKIKKELANILTIERYAFMFELIISKGFSGETPGKLSKAEKERLLNAINNARHSNISAVDALPEPQDQLAVNRIANWLSWVYREDLSIPSLSPISILGDSTTVRSISEICKGYNILKENKSIELQDGCSDIMDIREIMATTKSHQWADIIPLCVGHIGICNRTLNIEEAWIIPNVIGGFDFSTDLGMIHIPELDMAILRGIRPTFEALYKTTPNKVDLASLANCILKEGSGWKVRTLK